MWAPSHWCLDKLRGVYATRPATGPHKLRECIPLTILLRNRLSYALSGQEAIKICRDKSGNIKVDGKIRRDPRYPLGMMDVVQIAKTGENFRILYDLKGRFMPVRIDAKEASFKLCKVKRKVLGKNKIPYIVTHDGRTIRYPHPDIKKNDTVKVSLLSAFSLLFQIKIIFNTFFNAFSLTLRLARSMALLNSKTELLSSSRAETTSVVSAHSCMSNTTQVPTRLSTSRTARANSSPLVSPTFSSLVRVRNP